MRNSYEIIVDEIFLYSIKAIKEYYKNNYSYNFYEKLEKCVFAKINILSKNPYYSNCDDEYGESIRKMVLTDFKYNIFYYVNEEKNQIHILDIRHFKKNREKINPVSAGN